MAGVCKVCVCTYDWSYLWVTLMAGEGHVAPVLPGPDSHRAMPRQPPEDCGNSNSKFQYIAADHRKNNFYRLSFFPQIKEWNELEPSVAEAKSISQFKAELGRASLH
ncbi:hypothetical protein Bbelb_088650 [Branchiostoma belcheri]|nr:hypothetical protein Bbelb_088650 [Branchiostoma belcheri]